MMLTIKDAFQNKDLMMYQQLIFKTKSTKKSSIGQSSADGPVPVMKTKACSKLEEETSICSFEERFYERLMRKLISQLTREGLLIF